jgi:hypothetical protein
MIAARSTVPRASDSMKCVARSIVTFGGIGGSFGSKTPSTTTGLGVENACSITAPHSRGSSGMQTGRSAGPGVSREIDLLQIASVFRFSGKRHLLPLLPYIEFLPKPGQARGVQVGAVEQMNTAGTL